MYHREGCGREDGHPCSCDPVRGSWINACRECPADAMPGTSLCVDCNARFVRDALTAMLDAIDAAAMAAVEAEASHGGIR